MYKAEVKGKKDRGELDLILFVSEVWSPRNQRTYVKRATTVDDSKAVSGSLSSLPAPQGVRHDDMYVG